MSKVNPFQPNARVSSEMFAGRISEIKALENGLYQTKNSRPSHFLITGERGIGKSSLLLLIRLIATGAVESINYDSFNFIQVNVLIFKNATLMTLIKLIDRGLKRELGKIEKIRNFLDVTWGFVQRLKIMDSGIESSQANNELDLIVDDFSHSLAETCKRITNPEKGEESKDGIVFFIDEADNACSDLHLGYFFKAVTELLAQHNCNNIMFVVAGLPDVIEKMLISHESSIRVFNPLVVRTLSSKDRNYVIESGIDKGNAINEEKTTITTEAKNYISYLSEGYPHFIQQFSYSAFGSNTDSEISIDDVARGAGGIGGAIDTIGNCYYRSVYNKEIKSDNYRAVLSIMAENMNSWIKKSEIKPKFSGADHVLTDALKTLTVRKIILKNPSKNGEYRLQQKGFALWIKLFGEREVI